MQYQINISQGARGHLAIVNLPNGQKVERSLNTIEKARDWVNEKISGLDASFDWHENGELLYAVVPEDVEEEVVTDDDELGTILIPEEISFDAITEEVEDTLTQELFDHITKPLAGEQIFDDVTEDELDEILEEAVEEVYAYVDYSTPDKVNIEFVNNTGVDIVVWRDIDGRIGDRKVPAESSVSGNYKFEGSSINLHLEDENGSLVPFYEV